MSEQDGIMPATTCGEDCMSKRGKDPEADWNHAQHLLKRIKEHYAIVGILLWVTSTTAYFVPPILFPVPFYA